MKKITFLSLALALSVGTMCATTVQVTSTSSDPAIEGSLPYVVANAPLDSETTIEFNFEGETIDYTTETGMEIPAKTLTFDGINKANGKQVVIKGAVRLFDIKSTNANVTMKNITITGCNGIAITMSGGTFLAEKCLFEKNIDPKSSAGNNGGVMRISGGDVTFKNSVFYKNKGTGNYGGGAVCAYNGIKLRVEGCTFTENEGFSGGAIGVNVLKDKGIPTVYIANSTFANNIAADRGGAMYMQTAEISGAFAPVIVNCTFVGNLNGKDGGALLFWSRATTTMAPVLINNLFGANHVNPWDANPANDCHAFYLAGAVDANNVPLPQTVIPVTKNNVYCAAPKGFFSNTDKETTFIGLFKETVKNPLDEGDDYFNHQSSTLAGDMRVAMIAENSIAVGAGIASFESYEIPTTDQLGKARPAKPSVGAVEYAIVGGVSDNFSNNSNTKVWAVDNQLFVSGIDEVSAVTVFDLAGKVVFKGSIEDNSSLTIDNVNHGIYIVKIANIATKIIF